MRTRRPVRDAQRVALLILVVACVTGVMTVGCRVPSSRTVHQDERMVVTLQQEVKQRSYTHPVQVTAAEIASIFRGFFRTRTTAFTVAMVRGGGSPKPLLREDELQLLAPHLAQTLQQAGTNERAHFEVRMPGPNPQYDRDIVAGWVAVRDPYLYLAVEHFRTHVPVRKSDLYDRNFPTPPPPPRDYILYFEPGRFWIEDDKGVRTVEFRQFLKSAEASGTGAPRVPPAVAP